MDLPGTDGSEQKLTLENMDNWSICNGANTDFLKKSLQQGIGPTRSLPTLWFCASLKTCFPRKIETTMPHHSVLYSGTMDEQCPVSLCLIITSHRIALSSFSFGIREIWLGSKSFEEQKRNLLINLLLSTPVWISTSRFNRDPAAPATFLQHQHSWISQGNSDLSLPPAILHNGRSSLQWYGETATAIQTFQDCKVRRHLMRSWRLKWTLMQHNTYLSNGSCSGRKMLR